MKTKIILFVGMVCGVVLNTSAQKMAIKDLPVIAEKKSELIVADLSKAKRDVILPLSEFVEELQILKLDDAEEALVKESFVKIGDKYILVRGSQSIPCKLFDRKTGKFVCNVGSYGQGPGEYQNLYDMQLDELNDRIYLLPWNAKAILAYDLKGKLTSSIPLCFGAPKGRMSVDWKKNEVTMAVVPFQGIKAVVWTQTLDGKVIKSIAPGHLEVVPDFSNEVSGGRIGNDFSMYILFYPERADSVYHYNTKVNKLDPVFTLKYKNEPPIHGLNEMKRYFMGNLAERHQIDEYSATVKNMTYFLVDKTTLKGSFFTLVNDYLGDLEIDWPNYKFEDEYFALNMDPGNLSEQLEKALENKKLSADMKKKLQKLKDSISDNDNNYILYAKCR